MKVAVILLLLLAYRVSDRNEQRRATTDGVSAVGKGEEGEVRVEEVHVLGEGGRMHEFVRGAEDVVESAQNYSEDVVPRVIPFSLVHGCAVQTC